MGLEPTTFCMAIVCTIRMNAWFSGFRLNPIPGITGDSAVIDPPMVPSVAAAEAARSSGCVDREEAPSADRPLACRPVRKRLEENAQHRPEQFVRNRFGSRKPL